MGRDQKPARAAVEVLPGTRILCEALADRLNAVAGKWSLEVQLEDGQVKKVFRREVIHAGDLGRFDEPTAATSG